MSELDLALPEERATEALARDLAAVLPVALTVYLQGDLGAGKTTFVRAVLRALGHSGAVNSPTYTLVEPYEIDGRRIAHMDLYRLADPEELEFIGIRDLAEPPVVLFIEWPERGRGMLPEPSLLVDLAHEGAGRRARLRALDDSARTLLEKLGKKWR